MSYFSKFPRIQYKFDAKNYKLATDILKRFAIDSRIKDTADLFIRYQVREGESAQDIANRLYGNANLHWIIYLMNDVVDPYVDFPTDSFSLDKLIEQKYQGYSLFLSISHEGNFTIGETVRAGTGETVSNQETITYNNYTAVVLEWDATYRELVVQTENNISALSGTGIRIVGQTSGAKGTLQRRVKHTDAIHHFEDANKNVLNPLPGPLSDGSSPLTGYLSSSQNAGVTEITNRDYEEVLNRSKKSIKLLRPEYVTNILSNLESIFE